MPWTSLDRFPGSGLGGRGPDSLTFPRLLRMNDEQNHIDAFDWTLPPSMARPLNEAEYRALAYGEFAQDPDPRQLQQLADDGGPAD